MVDIASSIGDGLIHIVSPHLAIQCVSRMEAADRQAEERRRDQANRFWSPKDLELIHFVHHLVDLLLTIRSLPVGGKVDLAEERPNAWRWHTHLASYRLASWIALRSELSLGNCVCVCVFGSSQNESL